MGLGGVSHQSRSRQGVVRIDAPALGKHARVLSDRGEGLVSRAESDSNSIRHSQGTVQLTLAARTAASAVSPLMYNANRPVGRVSSAIDRMDSCLTWGAARLQVAALIGAASVCERSRGTNEPGAQVLEGPIMGGNP